MPQLDLDYDEEIYAELPAIVGGRTIALARGFEIIEPRRLDLDRSLGTRLQAVRPGLVTNVSARVRRKQQG